MAATPTDAALLKDAHFETQLQRLATLLQLPQQQPHDAWQSLLVWNLSSCRTSPRSASPESAWTALLSSLWFSALASMLPFAFPLGVVFCARDDLSSL